MNTCSVLDVFYVQHGACVPSGIYRIRNVKDGKIYIGQGADILSRWRQHRHALSKGNHTNRKLQSAWNYHGPDSFVFELVKECTSEVIGDEEIAALAEVPKELQYNLGAAGYSPTIGIVKTEENRLTVSRAGGGRPFFAKNLTTGEVRRFEHAGKKQLEGTGFKKEKIYRCLYNQTDSHQGHLFYYDPHYTSPLRKEKSPSTKEKRNRPVIGTSIATGEEIQFPYVARVKNSGFTRTGVIKCLSGEMRQHKGYRWRYSDGLPHIKMSDDLREKLKVGARKNGGSRTIIGVHLETCEEVRYSYIRAAAKDLNLDPSYISLALSGRMRSAGNFVWRYEDGMPHNATNYKKRTAP